MLNRLLSDEIEVIKKDGTTFDKIKASVQKDNIYLFNREVIVDEGDQIIRKLPNGKIEKYIVYEANFHSSGLAAVIPAHYQLKVKKITDYKVEKITDYSDSSRNVIIKTGDNARISIDSIDYSVHNNALGKTEYKIFEDLLVKASIVRDNAEIINAIKEMRDALNNKETFKDKYNNFIQAIANHITIFAPFISELTKYL